MPKDIINRAKLRQFGYELHQDISLDDILALTKCEDIVSSSEGRFTVVQDGPQRSSLEASWHIDGLSHEIPPSVVVLYCEKEGRGDITTDLAEIVPAFNAVDSEHQSVLRSLDCHYMSRSGDKSYCSPLVRTHPITGEFFLSLSSRGWVNGVGELTLEQISISMASLYQSFIPVVVQHWKSGDCLVFDNTKYVHRRSNPLKTIDPERRLIRVWLT